MKTSGRKVAIITGTSSGIGLETAKVFAQKGYKTYGLSRRKIGKSEFVEIQADVNDDESVKRAVAQVLELEGRIDVLVNNAGFSMIGAQEESSIAQAKAMFETNFFGVVRMSNAVLPIMRKQSSGRIIHISSIVGLVPAPYLGFYSASKHAVEGYSESLDHEIRDFGIRSIVIEPGFMKTSINTHALDGDLFLQDYSSRREKVRSVIETGLDIAPKPNLVGDVVFQAAESTHPKLRYPVGKDSKMISFMRRFAPRSIFDKSFRAQFKLD